MAKQRIMSRWKNELGEILTLRQNLMQLRRVESPQEENRQSCGEGQVEVCLKRATAAASRGRPREGQYTLSAFKSINSYEL